MVVTWVQVENSLTNYLGLCFIHAVIFPLISFLQNNNNDGYAIEILCDTMRYYAMNRYVLAGTKMAPIMVTPQMSCAKQRVNRLPHLSMEIRQNTHAGIPTNPVTEKLR